MATARPFAFNTGSTVSGTTQIGDLGVGVDPIRYDLHPGDITWYMGCDEELGHVIARPNPTFHRPRFLRSVFTEQGFLDLCNYISRKQSGPVFTNTLDAKNWIDSEGYWTTYTGGTGPTPTPSSSIPASPTPTPSSSIPATPTPTPTPSTSPGPVLTSLNLEWDNISNVPGSITDPTDETEWNTFFDLPTNGTAFTSATVTGNTVTLHGGGNMTIKSVLFQNNTNILGISETGSQNTVTTVGTEAFSSATNLATAELPGCTLIDGTAGSQWYGGFYNCTSLSTVDFTSAQTIREGGFRDCTSLTTPSFPALTSTGEQSFFGCTNLTTPSMPVLADIKYQAFLNCTSMTVAPGSNNVTNTTNVAPFAYEGCTSLTNPSFPLLTVTSNGMFQSCSGLVTPSFPSLTSITSNTFKNCTNLSTTAWSGVTFVGATAFQNCTSLTDSVDFASLDETAQNSFLNCTGFISLEFPSLTTLESGTFVGCTNLTSFVASGCTLTDIGAFNGCTALTGVTLPSLITCGSVTFVNCSALLSVSFPDVTTVGSGAFRYCDSLASVSLPSCTDLGGSVANNNVFEDNDNPTVTVPTALATVNGGNPDGDLVYVTDTLSGTVNYI